MNKCRVGVLGATGTVGQQIVHRLRHHPWFRVTAVAASDRSAGKLYSNAVHWRISNEVPASVANLEVQPITPHLDCDICLSALDSSVAGEAEEQFARSGYPVISNSRNHRMDSDVPLLVPEVNPEHIALIERQRAIRGYDSGFIATNPNCSTSGLVVALKPIHDSFGIAAINVVTMQALSGAGYPGIASLDALDNVIPYIAGEEEKLQSEPLKILGDLRNGRVDHANFKISAQCNRVPVIDGHMESVSLKLKTRATPQDVAAALQEFTGLPLQLCLPSAPSRPIWVRTEENRPQTRLDRDSGDGMTVVVGRIRECPVLDIRFTLLSHNLVRGAAGAAILNAELFAHAGYFTTRTSAEQLQGAA